MAKRRMISCGLVSKERFIMLPKAAQALYFHLIANADDDGIAEGNTVVRLIRARRRDLEALTSAGYVYVLEPASNIVWITGWQSFNYIPKGRGTPSEYRETLLEHFPDIKDAIIKPKNADNWRQNDGLTETEQNLTETNLKGRETETVTVTDGPFSGSGFGSAALSLEDLEKSCRRNHIKLSGSQLKQLYEQLKENDFTIGGQYIKDLGRVLRWYEKNPDAIVGPQFQEDDNYVTGIIEW